MQRTIYLRPTGFLAAQTETDEGQTWGALPLAGGPLAAGDAAERARQARFLAGRGFSADTIRRVLRGHLDDD